MAGVRVDPSADSRHREVTGVHSAEAAGVAGAAARAGAVGAAAAGAVGAAAAEVGDSIIDIIVPDAIIC